MRRGGEGSGGRGRVGRVEVTRIHQLENFEAMDGN